MKKLIAILAAALTVNAAPAYAVTLVNPDGSRAEPFQTWADSAKVPTTNETVVVHRNADGCPKPKQLCTTSAAPEIWFAQPKGFAQRDSFLTLLGIRFDYAMPEWKRLTFKRIVRDSREWSVPPNSPRLAFAMAYADCARGRKWHEEMYFGPDKYKPSTRSQYRRICRLIRQPNQ